MSVTVSPARDPAEASAFFRLACEALLVPVALAEPWCAREGLANLRVARVDARLAGGLTVQRLGQWFGGVSVPCGVVRCVAVSPEFRGAGVADAFLRHALLELREAVVPLAMLFPATQVVYRRVGFEQAGSWVDWTLPTSELSSRERSLPMQRVGLDEPALRAVYDAFARRSPGLLDRNEWAWKRTLDPASPLELSAYLLGPTSAPEGYLVIHTERYPNVHQGLLRIRDRAFLTPRALVRARAFLAEHRSVIERVVVSGGLVEPLFVTLPNQLQRIVRREDWMLRLVDVPAALRARGYARGVDAEVALLVHDDVLAPHAQALRLRVRDGVAEVSVGGAGDAVIDVRGLAALYSGHLSPEEIHALGYLTGDARAWAALGAIFAGPRPWMTEIV